MTRSAHCCCGLLRAEATGEPTFVGRVIAPSASGIQARPLRTFATDRYSLAAERR
jgi:hypothetical protein